jgi:hypothetical protein
MERPGGKSGCGVISGTTQALPGVNVGKYKNISRDLIFESSLEGATSYCTQKLLVCQVIILFFCK